jgi:hypothetical protein
MIRIIRGGSWYCSRGFGSVFPGPDFFVCRTCGCVIPLDTGRNTAECYPIVDGERIRYKCDKCRRDEEERDLPTRVRPLPRAKTAPTAGCGACDD